MVIDILFRHMFTQFHWFRLKLVILCTNLYNNPVGLRVKKTLGTFLAFYYTIIVFWVVITFALIKISS